MNVSINEIWIARCDLSGNSTYLYIAPSFHRHAHLIEKKTAVIVTSVEHEMIYFLANGMVFNTAAHMWDSLFKRCR